MHSPDTQAPNTAANSTVRPLSPPILSREQFEAVRPLLSRKELAKYLGMSERATHAVTSAPWFPAPVQLFQGSRVLKWRRIEVDEALASAPRRAGGGEPAQLQQARVKRQAVPA